MMHKFILILVALLNNLLFVGCASTSPGMKILEERANYSEVKKTEEVKRKSFSRSGSLVKKAWLFPHEMPTGDYFGGAWLHLVVTEERWNINEMIR